MTTPTKPNTETAGEVPTPMMEHPVFTFALNAATADQLRPIVMTLREQKFELERENATLKAKLAVPSQTEVDAVLAQGRLVEERDTLRAQLEQSERVTAEWKECYTKVTLLFQQAQSEVSAKTNEVADARGWQPIETAPKDGSVLLALFPEVEYRLGTAPVNVGLTYWWKGDELNKAGWRDGAIFGFPTHWMPLPTPPDKDKP